MAASQASTVPRTLQAGQRLGSRLGKLLFLSVFVVFFGAPLVWLLLAPTKENTLDLGDNPFSFGSLSNLQRAWANLGEYTIDQRWQVLHWGLNSVIYGVAIVALSCALCIPAGYALAVYRFPGRKLILIATLVTMTIPVTALVIPQFLELHRLSILNTRLAVILPSAFYPFGAFLAYIYYSTTLGRGLIEAARIDGCSELGIFTRIALPLSGGVLPVIAFFSFVASWNNYFLPAVTLSDRSLLPLPVGLPQMAGETGAIVPVPTAAQIYPIEAPEMTVALILAIVPVIFLFLFSQRFVRTGMVSAGEER